MADSQQDDQSKDAAVQSENETEVSTAEQASADSASPEFEVSDLTTARNVPAGPDRRQYIRRTFRSTAYLVFPQRDPIPVQTFDISLGGVGIVAPVNPPPKTECDILLNIPSGSSSIVKMQVPSQVMHSVFSSSENGFKVGFRFTTMPQGLTAAILRFMRT